MFIMVWLGWIFFIIEVWYNGCLNIIGFFIFFIKIYKWFNGEEIKFREILCNIIK